MVRAFFMTDMSNKRVAVIGGGAAGMSAGRRLSDHGVHVTVYEQAKTLGGRARSDSLEGCVVDTGAQLFGSGFHTLFEFANALGAGGLMVRSPGRDAVWRRGAINPITYGNVASMITSQALPASLKFKLASRYVPFLLRHNSELDANEPLSKGGDALDGESVAQWGARELGTDFIELLAYPLLGSYYGSTPEGTSVALYHALANAGLDVRVHAVTGGTGALFTAAAETLRARGVHFELNRRVAGVRVEGDGVSVDDVAFDGVILAVPPRVVESICIMDPAMMSWLCGVQYTPSAVLALVLNTRIHADYFGISIPRVDAACDIVAICVQQQKAKGLVPEDRSLLICLGAPAANEEFLAQPELAVERMVNAVERVLPGTRNRIIRAKLYRHEDGYPLFYPGYLRHLRNFPVTAQVNKVVLAGDYLVGPTVEGAMRSGERAARHLLDQLRAAA